MDIAKLIIGGQAAIAVLVFIAVIVLAFRRIRLKGEETFEKRDN